jgi:hypothetical protein
LPARTDGVVIVHKPLAIQKEVPHEPRQAESMKTPDQRREEAKCRLQIVPLEERSTPKTCGVHYNSHGQLVFTHCK